MKAKQENQTGQVSLPQNKKQWKIYQQLNTFSQNLNRLPDAREVSANISRSAPQDLLPMVF